MGIKGKITVTIIAVVTIVVDIIIDLLLWLNALVDGKYLIEPSESLVSDSFVTDTYYMRIGSLSVAMFVNLVLAVVLLLLLFIQRKR